MAVVRGEFMSRSDAYEELKKELGLKLEHAFDFMEAAFGNGQEMVIFVTELNTSQACVCPGASMSVSGTTSTIRSFCLMSRSRPSGKLVE